jgi:hypothetical protein
MQPFIFQTLAHELVKQETADLQNTHAGSVLELRRAGRHLAALLAAGAAGAGGTNRRSELLQTTKRSGPDFPI